MEQDAPLDLTEFRPALAEALEAPGMEVGRTAVERLERFAALFLHTNQRMNLTSITDPAEVAVKHFADSLSVLRAGVPENARLADIGTGGGFPGLPLAIVRPDLRVVLLDSVAKKVRFLNEACVKLGLSNCTAVAGRAEELAHRAAYREAFDVAVWRGLGPLKQSAELCLPFVRVGGKGIALKGPKLDEELSEARALIGQLGGAISRASEVSLPGGLRHRLLVTDKVKATPETFPREWRRIRRATTSGTSSRA